MSYCKNCGAEIEWLQKPDGRYIPVDPEIEFIIEGEGTERFYAENGTVLVGRLARPEEAQTRKVKINAPLGCVPHWRTCRARR